MSSDRSVSHKSVSAISVLLRARDIYNAPTGKVVCLVTGLAELCCCV